MPTWKQIMHYIGHYIPTIEILLPIKKKIIQILYWFNWQCHRFIIALEKKAHL